MEQVLVIEKLLAMPEAPKAKWWQKRQAQLIDCATWYCVTSGIQGIDRSEARTLPDPSSAEGKALARAAHGLNAQEWVDAWAAQLRIEMVRHVSLGRECSLTRSVSGWTKKEKSLSNKLAHCIVREMDCATLAQATLASLTV